METKRLILRLRIKKGFTKWKFESKFWDLVDKDSKKVLGHCGFHTWDEDSHQAEIAYELQKKYHKKGFMIEALQPIIAFGFNEMKLKKIEAYIKNKNLPSKRLITKLGFTPEEITKKNINNPNFIQYFSLLKTDNLKANN